MIECYKFYDFITNNCKTQPHKVLSILTRAGICTFDDFYKITIEDLKNNPEIGPKRLKTIYDLKQLCERRNK